MGYIKTNIEFKWGLNSITYAASLQYQPLLNPLQFATRRKHPPFTTKMKTALLVIDVQKYFGEMVEPPLPQIKLLNDFFHNTGRPVIFTQHGHTPDELIPPIKNQLIRKVGPENALMVNTESWELVPDIWKMTRDAPVVAKNTYDAFMETSLETELQKRGVERVLITGVMTDVCCDTTARSAFVRGYETWFIRDACWTDTQEQHDHAVSGVDFVLGRVHSTVEAVEMLKKGG